MPYAEQTPVGVLGIDVGGTKVALRAEGAGRPPYQSGFLWSDGADPDADLALLGAEVAAVRAAWGAPLHAAGIAMPATVDPAGRVTAWPSRPTWTGLDLGAALARIFPDCPTGHADDGDLAALAEARHAGQDDVVYLGVGTGIGGGIVSEGRSRPGLGRGSCELGHLIIDRRGERCVCGRQGCLQAVASGPATLRRATTARGEPVDFAALRDGLRAGDSWAVDAVRESAGALAAAVVGLGELLGPTVAIIGGGFATGMPGFVPLVAEQVAALARPGHHPPAVRTAALGGLSSLSGALLLARDLATEPPGGDPPTDPPTSDPPTSEPPTEPPTDSPVGDSPIEPPTDSSTGGLVTARR